jgi:hypothetical protein
MAAMSAARPLFPQEQTFAGRQGTSLSSFTHEKNIHINLKRRSGAH